MHRKLAIFLFLTAIVGGSAGSSPLLAQIPINQNEVWQGTGTLDLPMDFQETIFHTFTIDDWQIVNCMPHPVPLPPIGPDDYSIITEYSYFDSTESLYGEIDGIIHTGNPGTFGWYYGEGVWTSNLGFYGKWQGAFLGETVGAACAITISCWSMKYKDYYICGDFTGTLVQIGN